MKCTDCYRFKTSSCAANPENEDREQAENFSCFIRKPHSPPRNKTLIVIDIFSWLAIPTGLMLPVFARIYGFYGWFIYPISCFLIFNRIGFRDKKTGDKSSPVDWLKGWVRKRQAS